ncbi:MAG: hypothetical protein RR754_05255 [Oscillospiraceae bacterium]
MGKKDKQKTPAHCITTRTDAIKLLRYHLACRFIKSDRLTEMQTHSTPYNASTRQRLIKAKRLFHRALHGPFANSHFCPVSSIGGSL